MVTKRMTAPDPESPLPASMLSREEFEDFLNVFTHEIRNRLNGISLEAADLSERAGKMADDSGLQQRVRDCSTFLRAVRDQLACDDDGEMPKPSLKNVTAKLRARELTAES